MMKARVFTQKLVRSLRKRKDIAISQHFLRYKRKTYKFLRITSRFITPTDKIILISAGIHGEEIAGPITLLKYLNIIIDQVHGNGLRVIIYPIINPLGFEKGTRHRPGIKHDEEGVDTNNFLRYILDDGTITDDLKEENVFKEWIWSSDDRLNLKLPEETKLLHFLLKQEPLNQVVAAIDLHQDYLTRDAPPAAYHYIYGDGKVYSEIYKKIEKITPLLSNKLIDAGYTNGGMKSDENGSIIRYDGSLSDLLQRIGAKNVVTVETTGKTPLEKACLVNLEWILGMINLNSTNTVSAC